MAPVYENQRSSCPLLVLFLELFEGKLSNAIVVKFNHHLNVKSGGYDQRYESVLTVKKRLIFSVKSCFLNPVKVL
jgi:hypothetical protein